MAKAKAKFEIDLDKVGIEDDFSDGLEGSKTITSGMVSCDKPNKSEWFRVRGNKGCKEGNICLYGCCRWQRT